MAALLDPMPFWEALSYLEGKEAVASAMTTAEWQRIPVAVRVKASFSATLTSAKAVQALTDYMTGFVRGEKAVNEKGKEYYVYQGRAEFVANMRARMIEEGFGKVLHDGTLDPDIHEDDLRDLRGCRRLQLIFDTQTEQAASFAQWQEGQDPDILDVYPCQRFVRVRPVHTPRPYHKAAIGEVRRKDDLAFWIGLNRDFGLPWGPWGFNSGCGVEDVDRDEAEALGVIKPTDKVRSIKKDFLDNLEESVRGLDDKTRRWIQAQMENKVRFLGDTAVYNPGKPQPSAPAPSPKRPAKTPAQVVAQKMRIADTIAARQTRQEARRESIKQTVRDNYNKRATAALAKLAQRADDALARYQATLAPADWIAYQEASDALKKARTSWQPGGMLYNAMQRDIVKKQAGAWTRTYRDSLRFLAVDGVVLPRDKRGIILPTSVKIDARHQVSQDKPRKLTANVRDGLDLAAALVSPAKLPPSLGVNLVKGTFSRSYALPGAVQVSDLDTPAVIAHELAHVIEFARPDVLRKSAAFLHDRARGASPVPLNALYPGHGYRAEEKTMEDDWIRRGGNAYTGKLYIRGYHYGMAKKDFAACADATEILSMGIQRMLESPVAFQRQDPEFYQFIKKQLS